MKNHTIKLKTHLFFLLICLPLLLSSRQVDTFYGTIEIEEPILLELIDAPVFQRLKEIHQYGVAYYTTHPEEFSRYDHSLGVFAILREKGAPLEEQIAGLLHDVSHTAFSHVGDWVFGKENQVNGYQDEIHADYLEQSGFGDILIKYGFAIDQVLPNEELFPSLENSLPNLSADRIDYNLQGAYHQGKLTREEALLIFKGLYFIDNRWISPHPELIKKLTYFSLFMTQNCWGSPVNYITSRWLADAIIRGIEIKAISYGDFQFGTDQAIWDKLTAEKDPIIEKKMAMIRNYQDHFSIVEDREDADFIVKSKFRGIDPWIIFDGNILRITEVDQKLAEDYQEVRRVVEKGWYVKVREQT